jgi:hypothetical protein
MLKSKDTVIDKKLLLEDEDLDMTNQSNHVNGDLHIKYAFKFV